MENRIKEQQLELVEYIREHLLAGTELAQAQIGTIRLKLFKIGAVIIRNTRRIRFLLSSSYPYQHLWDIIMKKLALE
jgi:hypothetical protein